MPGSLQLPTPLEFRTESGDHGRVVSPAHGVAVSPLSWHSTHTWQSCLCAVSPMSTSTNLSVHIRRAGRSSTLARHEMLLHTHQWRSLFGSATAAVEVAKHDTMKAYHCVKNVLIACVIPVLVPCMEAFRSVGFRWAEDTGVEFSTIVPLIFGTLILASTFLLTLLLHHGAHELRRLADAGYVGFVVPAFFRTGMFVGANWALAEGTSATLVVMVMKSALLPGILGEMWLTKKWPWITQLCTIAALMLCITIYTLGIADEGMSFSVRGLAYSIGAAQCDFFGGLALEAGIRLRLKRADVHKGAEKIRCQLANEIWKAQLYAVLVLIFELEFVTNGLVRGWNLQIVLGAVLVIPFYIAIYNYSCIAVGTLQTNIFSSVDIGATCVLEFVVFGDPITTISGLLILVITLLTLIYSTLVIDLRHHAQEVLRASISTDVIHEDEGEITAI